MRPAIVLFLHALLIDAAVETFLTGSPARFVVIAGVAAYFLVVALVLKGRPIRTWGDTPLLATVPVLTLLGLLTLSTWFPEGLEHGLVVLGQPTPIVLALASALAVAAAGVVLVHVFKLPTWLRAAIAGLALYGVIGFAAGALTGTPYVPLLHGDSFWRGLPRWLQGAVVGANLTVVAALALGGGWIFAHSVRTRARWSQGVALLMSSLIAVQGFRSIPILSGGEAQPVSQTHISANGGQAVPVRTMTAARQRFFESLDELEAKLPKERLQMPALVEHLGKDPRRIFEHVQQSITYDHYDGILRGALGTLVSASGNSCDQAVLLQELLRLAGVKARVRAANADAGLNDRLVRLALQEGQHGPLPVPGWIDAGFIDRIDRQVTEVTSRVPGIASELAEPAVLPSVSSYCWVIANIDSKEQALDPILGSPPDAGSDVSGGTLRSLQHVVTIRLVLEQAEAGGNQRVVLHSASFPSETLGLEPITVSIAPGDAKAWDELKTTKDPLAALDGIERFYPTIAIRGQVQTGRGFTRAGAVIGSEGPLGGGGILGDRVTDMFGRRSSPSGSASTDRAASPTSKFAGLWLEYETSSPGSRTTVSRRSLVAPELVKPPVRAAYAAMRLLQQRQVLVSTFPLSDDYLTARLVEHYRRNRQAIEYVSSSSSSAPAPPVSELPGTLTALVRAQDDVARTLESQGGHLFRSRPGIVTLKQEIVPDHESIGLLTGIDIVETGFEAIAGGGKSKMLRARMGVASSLLEIAALDDPAVPINLLSLRQEADRIGVGTVAVAGPDDPQLKAISVPADVRRALVEDLNGGRAALTFARQIPMGPGARYGWWRVDRASGEVIAVLDSREGGAQEMTIQQAVITGAVVGAASLYLYCVWWTQRGYGACVGYGICGALFGALGGLLAIVLANAVLWGIVLGGGVGFFQNACQAIGDESYDPNDADNDGIPNDRDDDDNNNGRNDDVDPDDDSDGYRDCDTLPAGTAQPGTNCDALPGDRREHSDADHDNIGDDADTDDDNDGAPDCPGWRCDQLPYNRDAWQDADHDGIDDAIDDMVDVDGDGIDDQTDPCSRSPECGLPDRDGDHDPDILDTDPDEPGLHSYPDWSRTWRYPFGPKMPDQGGDVPRHGQTGWPTKTRPIPSVPPLQLIRREAS